MFSFRISDLITAESRYHTLYHSSFEDLVPKYVSQGQPTSSDKLEAFNAACDKMEDDSKAMQKGNDICPSKIKIRLKEKYDDSVQFAMFVVIIVVF